MSLKTVKLDFYTKIVKFFKLRAFLELTIEI